MSSFNPRPTSFLGVLAWAATEARLKGVPFCPLAGERVDGHAVEWLSESFDSMSPTHRYTVDVTDLATGKVTSFAKVWRKSRTYRATGRTTVTYSTPLGSFRTFDEVNAALVAEAQRRVAEALAAAGAEGEVAATPNSEGSDLETGITASEPVMGNPISAVDTAPMGFPMDVLAAPERHEQPQQRHYAGAQAVNVWPSAEEQALTRYRKWLGESACELDTEEGLRMAYQAAGAVECSEIAYGKKEDRALAILGSAVVALGNEVAELRAQVIAHEEALTPSAGTKYAYSGEFSIQREQLDENGDEVTVSYDVDWTTLKEVLAAVRARVQARVGGPQQQPEQQQAQALAVAVAGFEPECRQCAALLDANGRCPICPRPTPWEPCETGVRHHQTIPESREVAYAEHRKADRAATLARAEGADPARQRRLDEASQDAWTAFRRWRDADNFAARAGAHDHLHWADL